MYISVVGLGVEGQQATISLLKRGYDVYSSDINRKIDLSLLDETDLDEYDSHLDLEIGSHNLDKIYKSDAVAVSPSLFSKDICRNIIEKGIFLSDVLTKHRNIKTIAVTGTNGKTTTSHMIYSILKSAGYSCLIGGNGGGGFSGYIDLLMDANSDDFDYMVIEVCDMTLEFCKYVFDIDICVVTNIGYDHMDVHGSIKHYTEEVIEFVKDKPSIINGNDENLLKTTSYPSKCILFDTYDGRLNLFGRFNQHNADAAYKTAQLLGIKDEIIRESLGTFKSVEGRTIKLSYHDNDIVIGKTDNVDALKVVLEEEKFDIVVIGTARANETFRHQILDYIKKYNADTLIIFPGLEDTTVEYVQYLNNLGYHKDILVLKNIEDILRYINNHKNKNVFIGGNGQKKITQISNIIQEENKCS